MTDFQAHPDRMVPGDMVPGDMAPEDSDSSLESEGSPDVSHRPAGHDGEPAWPAEIPDAAGSATLVACTIATRSQLSAARVLRDSFLRWHPSARFVLLLLDRGDAVEPSDGVVITPRDVGFDDDEASKLALGCTSEQYRAVLRPRLLTRLLESGATVLYLEPSVHVFGELDELIAGLTPQRPLALFPRVLRPLHTDGLRPSNADLAESGTFDPSAFAVSPGAEPFLATWTEQVRADPGGATLFLDGAPALVDHKVVRDPGAGLSVWNAAQRELTATGDGKYTVDGVELRSVHFEGFQPQRPWLMSANYADRPRVLLSESPVLAGLCAAYRNALIGAGYGRVQADAYDALPSGARLPESLRREYLQLWFRSDHTGEIVPASPFEPHDEAEKSFVDWASQPADERQRLAGACRWTMAVWADDPQLRKDYPDPLGADAELFRQWCAGAGVASQRIPDAAASKKAERHVSLVDQLGVAVLGKGKLAELIRAAVHVSGLPSADTPYYPVVLRCEPGIAVPPGRHVIDIRPDGHAPVPGESAETWVFSEGRCRALRRAGAQVRVAPLPLPDPGTVDLPTRKGYRAQYDLSEEFVIGTFVDHANGRQDNVLGLVNAFVAAFPERTDVRLLIGVSGAAEHPEEAERLRLATVADPRIVLIESDVERAVLGASDCVASLHRTEGAAGEAHVLRLVEVAARGIPVITSDYGAATELLGPRGAKLVRSQREGEPDVDAAAVMLRAVAENPVDTVTFGESARTHLLGEHEVTQAGEHLREGVEQAYRNWRVKDSEDKLGQLDDPLRPLLVARHALHRPPDVDAGSRHAMTPALRKAVLKALGHYDTHIRDVMRAMVDGIEQTAIELLRRQPAVDVDADSLKGEVAAIHQRQEQLDAQFGSTEDGMIGIRADLADQHRKLGELEDEMRAQPDDGGNDQLAALTQRVDQLTGVVERTLDRLDELESKHSRDPELESSVRLAAHDAAYALQRTDVMQRILLREHERNTGSSDATSTPVLCDAGLLRLPSDDSLMLPWLSSHAAWDSDASALIDSLLEPDGIFVDVGAYVGYQTVRVLSRLGGSGAVVAVEPSESDRELLRRNVEVNLPGAGGYRLSVVESAAWDSQRELTGYPAIAGGVKLREKPAEDDQDALTIPAVRLDKDLENREELQGLTLSVVHVDDGGCVHRVLGGLVRLLRRDRPSIVCAFTPSAISDLGDDPGAALREFGTWGYELVPVGRTQAVSPDELLEAVEAAGTNTVKLWLRPKGKTAAA